MSKVKELQTMLQAMVNIANDMHREMQSIEDREKQQNPLQVLDSCDVSGIDMAKGGQEVNPPGPESAADFAKRVDAMEAAANAGRVEKRINQAMEKVLDPGTEALALQEAIQAAAKNDYCPTYPYSVYPSDSTVVINLPESGKMLEAVVAKALQRHSNKQTGRTVLKVEFLVTQATYHQLHKVKTGERIEVKTLARDSQSREMFKGRVCPVRNPAGAGEFVTWTVCVAVGAGYDQHSLAAREAKELKKKAQEAERKFITYSAALEALYLHITKLEAGPGSCDFPVMAMDLVGNTRPGAYQWPASGFNHRQADLAVEHIRDLARKHLPASVYCAVNEALPRDKYAKNTGQKAPDLQGPGVSHGKEEPE